jgi:sodium-dependent dicarboxylate transporter 2/3/5
VLSTLIQTICIFVGGYLMSRLALRAEAQELFVGWLARRSTRVSHIVAGIMLGSALLSGFLPNTLTALALLPVINAFRKSVPNAPKHLSSLLAMSLVYGSNIGGMISIIGTPASLYLLLTMGIYGVDGLHLLHFVSWFVFGLPVAISLLAAAWPILMLNERKNMAERLQSSGLTVKVHPAFPIAKRMVIWWLAFWIVLLVAGPFVHTNSALAMMPIGQKGVPLTVGDLLGLAFTVLQLTVLFARPYDIAGKHQRLMVWRDVVREFPLKGVLLLMAIMVGLVVLAKSGAIEWLKSIAPSVIPASLGILETMLLMVVVTIFATEFLHTTPVTTVMYPLAIAIAPRIGIAAVYPMIAITLASNCAFMGPVATPVNALAFTGIEGVSGKKFVKNGIQLNLASGVIITLWGTYAIPRILALFA